MVAKTWNGKYADAIKEMGLTDTYERFRGPWEARVRDGNDVFSASDVPGVDIWGLLYFVPPAALKALKASTAFGEDDKKALQRIEDAGLEFVDVRRLASDDFFDFFRGSYLERSLNGKIFCIETGVSEGHNAEDCIPTVHTFRLDRESGIKVAAVPMAWPMPESLEDTYNSYMALTPSGDHILASYEDHGEIDSLVLFKLSKTISASSQLPQWEKQWEEDVEGAFEGFFTIDGDFCVTENWSSLLTKVPGPLTKRRILDPNPSPYSHPEDQEQIT